ncbi:hypothetical protein [Streptomyces sp. NPDC054765]
MEHHKVTDLALAAVLSAIKSTVKGGIGKPAPAASGSASRPVRSHMKAPRSRCGAVQMLDEGHHPARHIKGTDVYVLRIRVMFSQLMASEEHL